MPLSELSSRTISLLPRGVNVTWRGGRGLSLAEISPVARPIVTVPEGSASVPASVPSARRAVRITPLGVPPVVTAGAAAGASAAPAFCSLKPHDAQNLLFVGFG